MNLCVYGHANPLLLSPMATLAAMCVFCHMPRPGCDAGWPGQLQSGCDGCSWRPLEGRNQKGLCLGGV